MGIVLAWAAGLGIVTYRWAKAGAPPTPGTLATASGFFAVLALVHAYPPARTVAVLTAVGVDIAALLQVLPGSKAVQVTGWPPLLINDPTVLLPSGSAGGGKIIPEGVAAAGQSSSSGTAAGSGQGATTGSTGSPVKPWG